MGVAAHDWQHEIPVSAVSGARVTDESHAQVSESDFYDVLSKCERLQLSNCAGHRTILDLEALEAATDELITGVARSNDGVSM